MQQYSIELSIPTRLTLESEVSILWYQYRPSLLIGVSHQLVAYEAVAYEAVAYEAVAYEAVAYEAARRE